MECNIIQIARYLELGEGGNILELRPAEKNEQEHKVWDRTSLTPWQRILHVMCLINMIMTEARHIKQRTNKTDYVANKMIVIYRKAKKRGHTKTTNHQNCLPLVKVSNIKRQLELMTLLTELPVKYIFRTLTIRG